MKVFTFTFNPFQENTYVLADATGDCIVVDPGCYTADEQETLAGFLAAERLHPVRLVNTHGHIDHILGNRFVADRYGLAPEMHADDVALVRSAPLYGDLWGIRVEASPAPSVLLADGDLVRFGETELQVLLAPGHSPGSICLFHERDRILVAGDVLFQGSIGRTDLPGGNYATLIASIRERIFPLGDDVVVYPGHGPATTVGEERRTNPFLQD
jgi:hydroxyacylglutathione hydrolase